MANYSKRRQRRLYGAKTAISAGILVALIGVYFIVSISGSTDRANAECTEQVTGTVTEVRPDGSSYLNTIEYTPGYSPMTVTLKSQTALEPGTEITVSYHPTSFTKVYIEGISPTGAEDRKTGIILIVIGAVLAAAGFFLDRLGKNNKKPRQETES